MKANAQGDGIIYAGTRRDAEEVADFVHEVASVKVAAYHGLLDAETRTRMQDAFIAGDLPLDQRQALLNAPALPFDGMNERGLAVGMAAVLDGNMRPDPIKETVDSLQVIRKMLDQAGTVDEAVAVLQQYNIEWGSGPALPTVRHD